MARILGIAVALWLLTGCAASRPAAGRRKLTCFTVKVIVTADDGSGRLVAPEVPVDVLVRSRDGEVLRSTKSDAEGHTSFEVCWSEADPAWQVEARLELAPQFVGTFTSFFNYTDTYCLTLPERIGGHCGDWGTGPHSLLQRIKP